MVRRRIPAAVCVRLDTAGRQSWPARPSASRSGAMDGGGAVAATTKDAPAPLRLRASTTVEQARRRPQQLLHGRARRSILPRTRAHARGGGQQPGLQAQIKGRRGLLRWQGRGAAAAPEQQAGGRQELRLHRRSGEESGAPAPATFVVAVARAAVTTEEEQRM